MTTERRSRRRRRAGQALVEFALVIPVFLLIMMGILDFGRAILAYNTLSNAARDGARVAIVDQSVSGGVPIGAQEAADQAIGLGLDPSADVDVVYTDPIGAACPSHALGCSASVTARYQFRAITPIIGQIVGPIALEATTTLPIESTKP